MKYSRSLVEPGIKKARPVTPSSRVLISLLLACLLSISTGCGSNRDTDKESIDKHVTIQDAGDSKNSKPQQEEPPANDEEDGEAAMDETTVNIYFADSLAESLLPEKRAIKGESIEELARAVVKELIAGPKNSELLAIIPPDTRLLNVKVADTIVTLDFSSEFIDNHPGGSASETMTLYGIVDSMSQLDGIKGVQFLVEGQSVETLAGHYDLKGPILKDATVKK